MAGQTRAAQAMHRWGRLTLVAVLGASGLAGCSDDKDDLGPIADATVADASTPRDGGDMMDARVDGGDLDASDGAPSDGAAADTGAADASDAALDAMAASDGAVAGPVLASASAQQSGRFGGDLVLNLAGTRGLGDIVAVTIELLGAQQNTIGSPQTVPLDAPITVEMDGGPAGGSVVLPGLLTRYPDVVSVRVTLVDDRGALSSPLELTLSRQPVLALGDPCDPALTDNRCGTGLGCKGADGGTTCQQGEAPTLQRVGYYVDDLGARILFEGSDPDRDVIGYTVRFFDAEGSALSVDLDGDDSTPGRTEFTGSIPAQTGPAFFGSFIPTDVFTSQVASVRLTVGDDADLRSIEIAAERSEAPARGLDATCDPRGFNRCAEGSVCAQLGDSSRCVLPGDAQVAACDAAIVLDPARGVDRVRGAVRASLWDPPAGCSPAQPKQPDRLVKLVLTSPARRVVLSTDHPYTGLDTELYLLESCGAAPRLDRCAADQPGTLRDPQAVLILTNLAAGTYFVVVDTFPSPEATSESFELTVRTE